MYYLVEIVLTTQYHVCGKQYKKSSDLKSGTTFNTGVSTPVYTTVIIRLIHIKFLTLSTSILYCLFYFD